MWYPQSFLASLAVASVAFQTAYAADLLTTLRASNATLFAQTIQNDPVLLKIFLSPSVHTVFAPVDSVLSQIPPSKRALWLRDDAQDKQARNSYHAMRTQATINSERSPPGTELETDSPLVNSRNGGKNQVAVADNGLREGGNSTAPSRLAKERRQALSQPTRIFTGLGNNVTVLQSRIPYDGGLVYTTDGLFTLPKSLSVTCATRSDTRTFSSLLNSTNTTSQLDSAIAATYFIPANSAFSNSSNITTSALLGHAVQGFSGYLPSLKNGQTLKTITGGTLTVTISGGNYYINGAKIISSNLILENGVAHVVDKIISAPVSPPPLPGMATSLMNEPIKYLLASAVSILGAFYI